MVTIEFERESDLIALAKAMHFIKFECRDYNCKQFSISPNTGNFYGKLLEQLEPYYKKRIPSYDKNNLWIEDFPQATDTLKVHIGNIENWKDLSDEIKWAVLSDMIYPLKCKEETKRMLYDYGNHRQIFDT